jgi:proteasome assembly chaperone (PAC2) family protein
VAVLIIEVTNAREVVTKRIGKLGGRLIGKVVDAEAQVEKALIQELETAFRDYGIEARILSVDGPKIIGRCHLELPMQVREERQVRLP